MSDMHPAVHDAACRNCAASLTGPYCGQCGQHAHESARSLHMLVHDAWHLFTHMDGLIWNTLGLLLFRPGRLTCEYFAEHRARYAPPFRLYFVVSVAFFGLASLTTSVSDLLSTKQAAAETARERAELHDELQQSDAPSVISGTVDAVAAHAMTPELAGQLCGHLSIGVARADERLRAICRHQLADEGKSMMHAFGGLVPKMMFVFLPLMALVMLPLYRAPRRYYVEHLVFLLHLQSALFLAMIVGLAFATAAQALPSLATVASIAETILFWYAVWYVYAAMRTYYDQSWDRTFWKFAALFVAYLTCFAIALSGTMIVSALLT